MGTNRLFLSTPTRSTSTRIFRACVRGRLAPIAIDAGTTWPLVTHAFASVAYGRCTSGSASGSVCRRGRDSLHAFFRQSSALSGALWRRARCPVLSLATASGSLRTVSAQSSPHASWNAWEWIRHARSLTTGHHEQLEPCWPRGGSACSRLTFDGGRSRPLSRPSSWAIPSACKRACLQRVCVGRLRSDSCCCSPARKRLASAY